MADQKKRTAWTVQDVINGRNDDTGTIPKFKSGYSGPKKPAKPIKTPPSTQNPFVASSNFAGPRPTSGYAARRSGGIVDYAWIVFAGIILACVLTAVFVYGFKSTSHGGIYYPTRIPTVGGVVKDIIEEYKTGGLGSKYAAAGGRVSDGSNVGMDGAASSDQAGEEDSSGGMLGNSAGSAVTPNSSTGATMALDSGSTYGNYKSASSYDELLEQMNTALSSNDFGYVGMKLSYEDEASGELIGYPQSVVEHFCQYMFDNSSKREQFLAEIKDADTYMAKNGSAFIVKLPRLQFTINMGYDGTTVSVSGFSDIQMDSGQSAVVSPLLPCMYTIAVSTSGGSQTSDVECDMGEGNLQINIGVTN